ncbi:MAG: 2-C-methyl-D-erythritol 4-phosphate cytidylyltransferase [Thermoleophilia bacterium]
MIVAAGEGARLGADEPKAFVTLAGRRMVHWSIDALSAVDRIGTIVVVVPRGRVAWAQAALGRAAAAVEVVEGGATRAISVARGVSAAPDAAEVIVVHDAARPLLRADLVRRVLDGIGDADGAIAAHPVADSLKAAGPRGRVGRSVSREGLWAAETPQAFRAGPFREALARAVAEGTLDAMTDCASIMEAAGRSVALVDSAVPNLKVTTEPDRAVVEALLAARAEHGAVH